MTKEDIVASIDGRYALFGLYFALHNRLQAVGDTFYDEITCKQFFLIACMNLFEDMAPTANDLAEVMGCSRQSVKEILNSLEKKGFVSLCVDEMDRRKQRIYLTEKNFAMAKKNRQREELFMECLYKDIKEENIKLAFKVLSKMEDNLKQIKGEKI